jgi:DNA-directed RNA polymerase specialized sigma subunit
VTEAEPRSIEVLGETLPDPDADTEAKALAPIEAAFVWACVWRYLPRRQALVLWWHYADDQTFEEIGQRLGTKQQEIKRSHTQALNRLRRAGMLQ